MKKENFVTLILGTVGGILFAVGICMCLLPEWSAFTQGVIAAAAGLVILLVALIVRRKMKGKPSIRITGKAAGAAVLGSVGVLIFGVGMHMVMNLEELLLPGVMIGIVGIVLLLCLIPLCRGLK